MTSSNTNNRRTEDCINLFLGVLAPHQNLKDVSVASFTNEINPMIHCAPSSFLGCQVRETVLFKITSTIFALLVLRNAHNPHDERKPTILEVRGFSVTHPASETRALHSKFWLINEFMAV